MRWGIKINHWTSYKPIQYLIPIWEYQYRIVMEETYMLDEWELVSTPFSHSKGRIQINILAKLWTNPRPNSNVRVTISVICLTSMLGELGLNPILNFNSEVADQINILAMLWANPITNSNSRAHGKEKKNYFDRSKCWMNLDLIQYPIPIRRWGIKINTLANPSYGPIQYIIPIQG